MMNASRKQIETKYQAAVNAMNSATTEAAYFAAVAELDILRPLVIAAEQQYPTPAETKRRANILTLRNRGLDC